VRWSRELKLTQAYSNAFGTVHRRDARLELSTEAQPFCAPLRMWAFMRTRTQPDHKFVALVAAQHAALREIAQQLSGV